jgi:hypothetical protein
MPTAVSAGSASCRACDFRIDCSYQAYALLETFPNNPLTQRERLALTVTRIALAAMPQGAVDTEGARVPVASPYVEGRVTLSAASLDSLSRLPAKVASQARQLMERGWFTFAKAELREGRNPATKGWRRIFCAELLRTQCTRASLELALVEQLKLSPASARVQVSVGMSIFAVGRIATERFGKFDLAPN